MIKCYNHCTTVYWKNTNLVNLNTPNRGISKATWFHVWRMIKRKHSMASGKMPEKQSQQASYERVRQSEKGMVHNRRNCLHAGDNTSKDNV